MGWANPKNVIDNHFLESLETGTSVAWIEDKIGIQSRLTGLPLDYIRETRNQDPREAQKVTSHTPTDLGGVEASLMALKRAGIKPEQLGMVICNCCTPYQTTPF
jgi:3-oxoacyl-[acyl-carrier-protein] synthase-3